MRHKQALSVAALAAVTAGLLATAWPAFADETPAPAPTVSVEPSFPTPPAKPIPTEPVETVPPTYGTLSPPPMPTFDCDPVDVDCVP
ncbi:hypothetical protein Aca07nite_04160 [Actinoplanes capillaceus]|uniref:Uncharacterized protein n=1 Tax=Actinoplanes campanulatus TaxID=113559 RepID=A0ABQ3W7X7_9ACTN|nr:hypothetical protein [Actinoplanes capillaceus]GID43141.1 hypothetical protein Aca07nite_04160 [Actinoplanes capillaceus]